MTPLRVGILGTAHMHVHSYRHCASVMDDLELVGFYEAESDRRSRFAESSQLPAHDSIRSLLDQCDAVMVCSVNLEHPDHVQEAVEQKKPVLCEKPIAGSEAGLKQLTQTLRGSDVLVMTAFPCPFTPAFESVAQHWADNVVGRPLAVIATNRGQCPFDWFVDPAQSGGGCMIDHVVHAADLLHRLTGETPEWVHAVKTHRIYGQSWEDGGLLQIRYPSGVFATLDSSWSRPKGFPTWGDLTLRITGETGVIEADLFRQALDHYGDRHSWLGYGTNADFRMVRNFVEACRGEATPRTTWEDGVKASQVALAAYASVQSGEPEALPDLVS